MKRCILLCQPILECGGKRKLILPLQRIQHRHVVAGHIGQGACDLSFSVITRHRAAVGGIIHLRFINITVIDYLEPLVTDHNEGIHADIAIRVVFIKIRVYHRILILHPDMSGKVRIPIQRLLQGGILLFFRLQYVDCHILRQIPCKLFRRIRERIKFFRRHVNGGKTGRQLSCRQI